MKFQMLTGKVPLMEYTGTSLGRLLESKERTLEALPVRDSIPLDFYVWLKKFWTYEYSERPSVKELVKDPAFKSYCHA
jgi:hypothetical protein